jgi:NAD(P)H-nitrite reductase large subunit
MARIVIIGNSAAGFSCCAALAKQSLDNEIIVISQENSLPYKRSLLIDYLSGNIKENELFLCNEDFYEKNKIKLLKDAKAVRVDTKKQTVILKDNNKINYDFLVIATGKKADLPDIPGSTKDGVYAFYTLEDIPKIKQQMMLADTICVVGESNLCLRLCEVITSKDKQVKIISSPKHESSVHTEKAEWMDNLEVSEIIGEGAELKALKLNNGKVIGTSLIMFVGNYLPCADFLTETGIRVIQGYVAVDDTLRTNIENIFACGSVCENENFPSKLKSWEDAVSEGALVGSTIIELLERRKTSCQMY